MSISLAALAAIGSVAATGYGAIKSSLANDEAMEQLRADRREDQRYYRRLLARDYVNSSENQSLLRRLQEMQRRNYERARATNVVAGGTDASLAAMQAQGNDVVTRTAQGIAARADAYKDSVRQAKRASDKAYSQQMFGIGQQRAQTISNAAGQASKAFAGIAGAVGAAENPYGGGEYSPLSMDEALAAAQQRIDAQTAADLAKQDAELQQALQKVPVFGTL